jgi:predicted nucleotidyltransferase component of viral defense system
MVKYLHEQADFKDLLLKLEEETGIIPTLLEKDYWLMHVLYGLTKSGYVFELKGGTSLSKGFHIIDRFSEDIDIYIHPAGEYAEIEANLYKTKKSHIQKRKDYYDFLTSTINIDGITRKERDVDFDNTTTYKSGGIRLYYNSITEHISGVKSGILLEVGFDNVIPNLPVTISSWAYDRAVEAGINIIDNRAIGIKCYDPRYTFVEKLQTIATKYRKEREKQVDIVEPEILEKLEIPNLIRQYYDLYCLLDTASVQRFIGTDGYHTHKKNRFPAADYVIPIADNQAFLLDDEKIRHRYEQRYIASKSLYYKGQPDFHDILTRIRNYVTRL